MLVEQVNQVDTVISAAEQEGLVLGKDGQGELEDDPGAVGEEPVHDVGSRLVRDDADEDGQKPGKKPQDACPDEIIGCQSF